MEQLEALLRGGDVVGTLSRTVPVRLLDISSSGCLLECGTRVHEGMTGAIALTLDGEEYTDDIRVIRCSLVAGAATYRVGVQFLWTTLPRDRSLRMIVSRLHAKSDGGHRVRLMDWKTM